MKKFVLYVTAIGVVMSVATYLINENSKSNISNLINEKSKPNISKNQSVKKEFDGMHSNISDQELVSAANVEEEITDAKNASAYSIHERHTEAANIMYSAFENIYKDIESIERDEKKNDSCVVEVEVIVNNSELDSVSDELDDLLK